MPRRRDGSIDKSSKSFNPLFFLHFQYLTREEFEQAVANRFADNALLYRSLAKDIYAQGVALGRTKYRFLRYSYLSFLAGLLISASLAVAQAAVYQDWIESFVATIASFQPAQ